MASRDLIVIGRGWDSNSPQLQKEVQQIDRILYNVEGRSAIANAHEVIDINRYKRIDIPYLVEQYFSEPNLKPFVFIINKN